MIAQKHYRTVREAAGALLLQTSYVDVYGRNVGLTYQTILAKLHALFPLGSSQWPAYRTSLQSLRKIAYAMNSSQYKMPVRRRSVSILAREYARALLVQTEDGIGIPFERISKRVKRKYPEVPRLTRSQLQGLSRYLAKEFALPPREK